MKINSTFRYCLTALLVVIPFLCTYAGGRSFGKPVKKEILVFTVLFQDSIPRQRPNSRSGNSPQRPPQTERDESVRTQDPRSIKQVPRSVPKLKPQPVGERMRMPHPPMKIPKKGYGPRGF